MEKDMMNGLEVLLWLPVGYMIAFPCSVVPPNFIEVNGQRLSKAAYPEAYAALKSVVEHDGDYFILPTKDSVSDNLSAPELKMILKLR